MYNALLGNYPFSVGENVCPAFDEMIEWDVRSISSEFVLWMCHDHAQTGSTSLVGILSSSAFENMISKFVNRSLSKHVRLLVKLTSVLYCSGGQASYADCDSTTLWSLRSVAGTRVLQELVSALCNTSLAASLLEKLTALFLVLFATIIAVGYSEPRRPTGDLSASTCVPPVHQSPIPTGSCNSGLSAKVFSEAQKHLLSILAHHMVYIAERINLLEPNVSRKRIIEGSACRWNRTATFQWNEMPASKDANIQSNVVSSGEVEDNSKRTDPISPTRPPVRCYHLSRSHSPVSSCRLAGGFGTCVHEPSLNTEPSPMDHLLASNQQMTSTPQSDLDSVTCPSHSTHRCSSDQLPSITARDGNYSAFECLAETDEMCVPFLCTDDDDDDNDNNANEASSMHGTCALTTSPSTLTTSLSTLQSSNQSASTAAGSPHDSASTNISAKQASICRSCKFVALPFSTLDENETCQFCSALPECDGDISPPPSSSSDGLSKQRGWTQAQQRTWGMRERGGGNLLV